MTRLLTPTLMLLWCVVPCLADPAETQLREQIRNANLVLVGEMETDPEAQPETESGVHHYHCLFKVKTLLKGTVGLQSGLQVSIVRIDQIRREAPIPLEKGREYLLFLKHQDDGWWKETESLVPDPEIVKTVSRLIDESFKAADAKVDPARQGTLKGRLIYDGERPLPAPLQIDGFRTDLQGNRHADGDLQRLAKYKPVDESLLVGPDGGIKNVLIWITDKSIPIPPIPPVRRLPPPVTLTFKEGKLHPHVLAWRADERMIQLRNEDPSALNLHWTPGRGNEFNRLLKPNSEFIIEAQALTFPAPIRSEIYPSVQPAFLFPCEHPYFAVTDSEGFFSIPDIPFGNWQFRAWHERSGYVATDDWPAGRFTMNIDARIIEMATLKLAPAVFERKPQPSRPAEKPLPPRVENKPAKPSWQVHGEERRRANEPDNTAEWVGTWRMRLPAGFTHQVTLKKTPDGLLKMECQKQLNLLGTFAFAKKQLRLVETEQGSIDDYIWQLSDEGKFILITDKQGTGGTYIGAVLERD